MAANYSMNFAEDPGIEYAETERRLDELLAASEEARRMGEHASGARQAREAAGLAEELGLPALEAGAYSLLATHQFRLGENEASLGTLHRALALYTELDDSRGISHSLNGMVMAYHELGLQEEALECAARSLDAAKQSGDPVTLAWAYNRAGLGHGAVGNLSEGISSLEFAVELAREAGDEEAIFAALNNLVEDLNSLARNLLDSGEREHARERMSRALELGREALELARRSHNWHRVAIILLSHGSTLSLIGEHDRAREALEEAEDIAKTRGYRPVILSARYSKARLELDRGQLRRAISEFRALLGDVEAARDGLLLLDIHHVLYRAYKQLREFQEALEHHERYTAIEREQKSQQAQTRARILSAQLELDRAQLEARRATLEAEIERSRTRELEAQAVALRRQTEALTRRADEDTLTGLWNRRHVEQELPRLMREAAARGEPVSVVFVDADHFKSINDRFGHLVGDQVLRSLADVLRSHVRPTDVVARLGGEEFIVLLPGASDAAAVALGQRLCDAVRETDWGQMTPGHVPSVSVGVAATMPPPATGRELERQVATLLGRADEALYAAKRAGRDRVVLAD
jgi:diguanylate cyclase (GGDEF)-like protein